MQRVALVTGANRGIGREVARGLAARGYRTLLSARDLAAARAAAEGMAGDVVPCRLDVTDADTIAAAAAGLERLDVLVTTRGSSTTPGSARRPPTSTSCARRWR
jgi:NAD(P)-dependent dehydrogenase (short-subunit alcohol dehydrogenase family)